MCLHLEMGKPLLSAVSMGFELVLSSVEPGLGLVTVAPSEHLRPQYL